MRRVLVTGASGFIGLPVVVELASRGEEVHALSTRRSPPEVPGVRWHRVDLLSGHLRFEELAHALAPECLVHLAWVTDHERLWDAPENVVWVERSLQIMRAFVRHGGRRLVMLGSCAEYDWSAASRPLEESSSPAPATLYGTAKDALRRAARAYTLGEGIEFAWGRPFFLYGPREAPDRLVPSVVRSLLADRDVATSSGRQIRDFMHVEDVASAVVALLDSLVVGEVNIASGVGVTVGEVVDRIVRLIGRPELIHRGALPDRPGEPPMLVADVTRLQQEVGYRPRWTLTDGLAMTVRWWQEHGS